MLLFDILSNVFVAIEAESRLRRLVEALVALGAVFFPFGMARDHLAWHQSGFDIVGPGGADAPHPQCEHYEWQMAKESLHRKVSGLVHVDGNDVKHGACRQEIHERDMQDMPQ